MSDINPQIDAAVALMKARAAEFDDAGLMPMDEWVKRDGAKACTRNLLKRAARNLREAEASAQYVRANAMTQKRVAETLCDTMNLCALVLSVLGEEAGE